MPTVRHGKQCPSGVTAARYAGALCCVGFAPLTGRHLLVTAVLLVTAARVDADPVERPARSRFALLIDLAGTTVVLFGPSASHSFIPLAAMVATTTSLAVRPVAVRAAEVALIVTLPLAAVAWHQFGHGDAVPAFIWLALVLCAAGCWYCWWRYPLLLSGRTVFSLLSHDMCGLLASVRWAVQSGAVAATELDDFLADRLHHARRISELLRPSLSRSFRTSTTPHPDRPDRHVRIDAAVLGLVEDLLALIATAPERVEVTGNRIRSVRRVTGDRWEVAATLQVANRLLAHPHRVLLVGDGLVLDLRAVPLRGGPARSKPCTHRPTCSSSTAATPSTGRSTPCPALA